MEFETREISGTKETTETAITTSGRWMSVTEVATGIETTETMAEI